jgi:hypothetical protein
MRWTKAHSPACLRYGKASPLPDCITLPRHLAEPCRLGKTLHPLAESARIQSVTSSIRNGFPSGAYHYQPVHSWLQTAMLRFQGRYFVSPVIAKVTCLGTVVIHR